MKTMCSALVVSVSLGLAGCGANAAQAPAVTTTAPSSTAVSPSPTEPTTPPAPKFKKVDAEEMCLAYSAVEQMTGYGDPMSAPAGATQVRLLGVFSKKIPLARIQAAASKTVASVQGNGKLDPGASSVLAGFCAPYSG